MAKSRSKSPAARKSGGGGFDLNDGNVQLVIAVAAVTGLTFASQKNVMPADFLKFFASDHTFNGWPWAIMLTLHVLNSVGNMNRNFWVADFVNAVIASFGGWIVADIMAGNGAGGAQRLLADEGTVTLVFVCWYLTNHNLPLVDFNLWGTISDFGGEALANVMNLASSLFTTNLIIGACGASGTAGAFGFPIFTAVATGVAVGCAGDYFPLNKGVSVNAGAAFDNAALISIFIATDGFTAIPLIGKTVGPLLGNITGPVGTNADFVRAVTVVNHLFGQFIPMNPLDAVYDGFYKITGLNRG